MSSEACCTCAALLTSISPVYDEKTEKPAQYERRLACCNRAVCARCITDNPRFATYCPFCQVSIVPSPLPQGLRDPPAYSPSTATNPFIAERAPDELPPPYTAEYDTKTPLKTEEKGGVEEAPDVLHFVDANDSITSLSLQYGVPAEVLRRINGIYTDHLLAARRTILIPGEYYKGGVSLSPRPPGGEDEEIRKRKVRQFMVGCKVAEYDVALMYLQQAEYNLDEATEAFKADERWEKEHPLEAARKGKLKAASSSSGRRKWAISGSGGGLTGQLI